MRDFITAYIFFFGGTKKHAKSIFKQTDEYYHRELIYGWKEEARKSFYTD